MKQLVSDAIVLSRTDYGEADRIITFLAPHEGKLRLIAKGVRRVKSKLAGGIELFSVSTITFVKGRGEIGTLVSTRLVRHYNHIVQDLERTMLGYDLIKQLNTVTEDQPEPAYFELLKQTFESLDDENNEAGIINFWFLAQLLKLAGHAPNLHTDTKGNKLQAGVTYAFSFDHMAFVPAPDGRFQTDHIKFLRLGFAATNPRILGQVQGGGPLLGVTAPLVYTMRTTFLRV